jgi:hypothetical protein
MRRWFLNILAVTSLALFVVSAGLWIWGYGGVRYLHAHFVNGHYDGDRSWSGSYFGTYRGQLCFERGRFLKTTGDSTKRPLGGGGRSSPAHAGASFVSLWQPMERSLHP